MDPVIHKLDLLTSDGRPLVHKFYRQPKDPHGLLVTFPGHRYGVDGPLLYYPSELLGATGWDTLALSYGFQSAMMDPQEYGLREIMSECQTALAAVLAKRDYPHIGLVGKSLGTGIIAQLCYTMDQLGTAQAAYLTPLLGTPFFDPLVIQTSQPAFLAMGTKDRFFDQDALEHLLVQKPMEYVLVEGADHSMDVAGDLAGSIAAVKMVVGKVVDFLMQGG
jgi:predicted alpha/beta-hydrolase family hydrolase